jgi:hypothetical protein
MSSTFKQIVFNSGLYVRGLLTQWITRSSFSLNPGQCRDSTNTFDMDFSSPVTVDLTKNGIGGLDVGDLAPNEGYSIYAIGGFENSIQPSAIATLSTNVLPAMPNSYQIYRRVGYFTTRADSLVNTYVMNGNNNEKLINLDVVGTFTVTANSPSYTTLPLTIEATGKLAMPQIPGLSALISGFILFDRNLVVTGVFGIRTTGLVDTTGANTNNFLTLNTSNNGLLQNQYQTAPTAVITGGTTAPSVDYSVNSPGQIRVCGWIDSL